MSELYKVCKACKNSDSVSKNGSCVFPSCGGGNCFKDFTPRENPAEKTLLDEFAMAAMKAIVSKTDMETTPVCAVREKMRQTARGAYRYARAMMKERARRDEMGNVKEAVE